MYLIWLINQHVVNIMEAFYFFLFLVFVYLFITLSLKYIHYNQQKDYNEYKRMMDDIYKGLQSELLKRQQKQYPKILNDNDREKIYNIYKHFVLNTGNEQEVAKMHLNKFLTKHKITLNQFLNEYKIHGKEKILNN